MDISERGRIMSEGAQSAHYVVIENTPGYMPDDDDPAVFENIEDARVYASDRLSSLLDSLLEWGDDDISVLSISGSFQEDRAVYVSDTRREHDLGRVIEIMDVENES
jgi:hypothetical protein